MLGQVAAGNPKAVRQCIAEYGPLVWAIARRFSSTPAAAEDAVQEIFVELWKHAGRYDPGVASEPAFIAMVARRRMIDRLRRAEARPQIRPLPDSLTRAGDPDSVVDHSAEAALAAGALASLDPRQRRMLALAIAQGMTHEEIADVTGAPLGTVKSLVRRALVAVRKRLLARQAQAQSEGA